MVAVLCVKNVVFPAKSRAIIGSRFHIPIAVSVPDGLE
jgi:hypothetical protein